MVALTALGAHAATPIEAHFTGAQSCASSYCHGGGKGKDQFQLFNSKDIHNHAHDILASNRSTLMGASLGITDVTKDARCTVCHSPQQALPPERFAAGVKPPTGVGCETCHGAAEPWLRFHTRTDITHDQRVGAGLREISTVYARSNVCVACHLYISDPYVKAGHPEMFFELAGQSQVEPPHWKEENDPWLGPRLWLIGQATALREISWRLTNEPNEDLAARWRGLRWLLRQFPAGSLLPGDQSDYHAVQSISDRIARTAASQKWSKETTLGSLKKLAGLSAEFRDAAVPAPDQRRRAEVLILAIDRLWESLKPSGLASPAFDTALSVAAKVSRGQAGFQPDKFAAALEQVEVSMELLNN